MKKEQLPQYLQAALEGEALAVFIGAVERAASKGVSTARQYAAGFVALQTAGYSKGPSGKWTKESLELTVHLKKVQKANDDLRQVFGFFSVVETDGIPVIDSQGDVIVAADIEKAIYRYVKFSGMGDDRHDTRCKAKLIESMWFSKEKQDALGIDLGFVGWWGGFEVHDDAMWAKIKTGEYESFSIGGAGRYERFDL